MYAHINVLQALAPTSHDSLEMLFHLEPGPWQTSVELLLILEPLHLNQVIFQKGIILFSLANSHGSQECESGWKRQRIVLESAREFKEWQGHYSHYFRGISFLFLPN